MGKIRSPFQVAIRRLFVTCYILKYSIQEAYKDYVALTYQRRELTLPEAIEETRKEILKKSRDKIIEN